MALLSKFKQGFGSTFSFFTESWTELKKVRWPGRKELTTYTMVVVIHNYLYNFVFLHLGFRFIANY